MSDHLFGGMTRIMTAVVRDLVILLDAEVELSDLDARSSAFKAATGGARPSFPGPPPHSAESLFFRSFVDQVALASNSVVRACAAAGASCQTSGLSNAGCSNLPINGPFDPAAPFGLRPCALPSIPIPAEGAPTRSTAKRCPSSSSSFPLRPSPPTHSHATSSARVA